MSIKSLWIIITLISKNVKYPYFFYNPEAIYLIIIAYDNKIFVILSNDNIKYPLSNLLSFFLKTNTVQISMTGTISTTRYKPNIQNDTIKRIIASIIIIANKK